MVVKIQPPAHNITNAIVYNEKKMTASEVILSPEEESTYMEEDNTGHVLATRNVPDTSTLENEFERLRWLNKKTSRNRKLENPTFHMSVNPGELDRPLPESEIVAFTDELMERLGYKDNPYRIFRHDDIERTHFHVVGTRIGQDGKKVRDSFENARCEKICRELATKYGYIYGLQKAEGEAEAENVRQGQNNAVPASSTAETRQPSGKAKKTREKAQKEPKTYIPPFDMESEVPASDQYRSFHAEAMKWSFTTPEQYAAILKYRFNTDVELQGDVDSEGLDDMLVYAGLGKRGNEVSTPVNEKELGINALNDVLQKCAGTEMRYRRAQRERLEKLAAWAAEKSEGWEDFRRLMERKGVITVISWSEQNEAFGLTWLDRATKCAWKGSETAVDLNWLKETVEKKGWRLTRHYRYEKAPRQTGVKKSAAMKTGKRRTRLGSYSDPNSLRQLMDRRNAGRTRRSNADASKNRSDIRYGDENDKNDIII